MAIAMSLLSSSEPLHPGQPLPEMPTLSRNSITAPLGTGAWPAAAPAVALYIDRQQLSRDCVGEQLAGYLADWTVRSVMRCPRCYKSRRPRKHSTGLFRDKKNLDRLIV